MADELDPATPDADADGTEDRLEDPSDEIDPELISLPRTKARIGLVLSLSVVIFCGYIMAKLHGDLRFSRQPATPQPLTTMNDAIDPDNTDRFVELRAVPDRAFAVRVARNMADPGSRLVPVQGSNGKLWLLMSGNVWMAGIRYNEIYRGRLRELAHLPFFDDLGHHVRSRGPEPRFVTAEEARRALSQGTTTLVDPAGDAITVGPDTAVRVYDDEATEVHRATWRELTSQGNSLAIGTIQRPWIDIAWLAVEVTRDLDPDALVLVTDERPETYWYMLPLFGALGLFGLLFSWALVRTVRAMLGRDASES